MRGGPTSVSLFQTLCRTLCRNYPSSSLDLGVEGIAGRDRGKCWQGNAPQDQRHGGWILNTERQSGRQSEDKVRKLLDSSRQDVQTPGTAQRGCPHQAKHSASVIKHPRSPPP